jgi:hypothetical protein
MGFEPPDLLHGKEKAGEGVDYKLPAVMRFLFPARDVWVCGDLTPNSGGVRTD